MKIETVFTREYLLSETATRIWQTNNEVEQNKMFVCVIDNCKEKWFKGLVFNITIIPKYKFLEMAEDAFLEAWLDFNKRGKAGLIKFTDAEYTPYLKQTFRNIFFKHLSKEIKEKEANKEFYRRNKLEPQEEDFVMKNKLLREKMNKIANLLSAEENKLMQMKFEEHKSYSVIAEKMQILKKSCIQKMCRIKLKLKKNIELINK